MNKICFGFVFLSLLVSYGCVEQQKSGAKLQVIPEKADTDFPEFLAGVWEADDSMWAFKFEPDGKISRLVHIIGVPIKVEEGMYYSENPDYKGSGLFMLGPCDTNYDPNSKVLKVSIMLDYFRIQVADDALEGYSKDLFEGPVSEKDLVWNVEWRSYSALEGGSEPDVNEIDANPQKLVFRKLDLKELDPNSGS
jgi:hypothetical protein